MNSTSDPLIADRQFFDALSDGNGQALDRILGDDFVLIDVMSGSLITKPEFLTAIDLGQVTFDKIEPVDNRVRHYQGTAVITGRTEMNGQFGGKPFAVSSRYTHVFIAQQSEWRLVSAQGTQISAPPGVG